MRSSYLLDASHFLPCAVMAAGFLPPSPPSSPSLPSSLPPLGAYAESAPLIFWTLRTSYPAVMAAGFLTLLLAVTMGTLMYLAEHGRFQVSKPFLPPSFP